MSYCWREIIESSFWHIIKAYSCNYSNRKIVPLKFFTGPLDSIDIFNFWQHCQYCMLFWNEVLKFCELQHNYKGWNLRTHGKKLLPRILIRGNYITQILVSRWIKCRTGKLNFILKYFKSGINFHGAFSRKIFWYKTTYEHMHIVSNYKTNSTALFHNKYCHLIICLA